MTPGRYAIDNPLFGDVFRFTNPSNGYDFDAMYLARSDRDGGLCWWGIQPTDRGGTREAGPLVEEFGFDKEATFWSYLGHYSTIENAP